MNSADNTPHSHTGVDTTLTEFLKYQASRQFRDAHTLFYSEGVRNFIHAVDNGFAVETVVYSPKLLKVPLARKFVRQLRRQGVTTVKVVPEHFREVSCSRHASGISFLARQRWQKLNKVSPRAGLCWIVLEQVRSPGNLGTLIRTSEAIGGAGFILIGGAVDPYAPVTIRASMGGLFRQQLIRTNQATLQHWVQRHRCHVIGASPDGSVDFHRFTYPRPTLLFLGEERKGLTSSQRTLCRHLVNIPMCGEADSLNVAVAGSLLLYEVHRTRSGKTQVQGVQQLQPDSTPRH